MSGLTLHPKKGVNPRLTFCPRCGGEGQSLMLIGVHDKKGTCSVHGTVYGAQFKCPAKECGRQLSNVRSIKEHERLPDSQPCALCEKEIDEHRAIVHQGGVYWKCTACKKSGVIKPSHAAETIRLHAKVETPKPVGVEFDVCEHHTPKES